MGLAEFLNSGECRSRAHCAACRDEGKGGAIFRAGMASRFSISDDWWPCPHCGAEAPAQADALPADWCHRFHAPTDPARCAACKDPATARQIRLEMLTSQRPPCRSLEATGELRPCIACGGKSVLHPVYQCKESGQKISPRKCKGCDGYTAR